MEPSGHAGPARTTINTLKAHALLSKALANDPKPIPSYLFPEIACLTQSPETCAAVLSQLLKVITPSGYPASSSSKSSTFIGRSNSTTPGAETGTGTGPSSSRSEPTLTGKLFGRIQGLAAPPPPVAMQVAYHQQEQRRKIVLWATSRLTAEVYTRAQLTMDHLDDIFDSADKPMEGNRWWLKAEDPWQCLATCIEVADAIRSGDPETYMSRIPVHQDGTCNGLQHYAALGGDMAGAQQVNLVPSDSPQDVYSGVARSVERMLEEQAAGGIEAAQMLVGKISRKIVKQTVMTNVYGVTFIGARAQIENRLKETPGIPEDQVRGLSTYLTQQVFASIGEMFTGARAIQDWLAESARRIAKSVPRSVVNPDTDEIQESLLHKKRKKQTSKQAIADQQMTS
ncbi:DNA-directed RNA polymerase, partial [Mortierella sp. 14UC]